MNQITPRKDQSPAQRWRWKAADGSEWFPEKMVTRHLFFTVRMIWNHSVPPHMRTGPHRRHEFGPFYTQQYMQTAAKLMIPELLKRQDITPAWQRDIDFIKSWFYVLYPEESKPLPAQQRMIGHG